VMLFKRLTGRLVIRAQEGLRLVDQERRTSCSNLKSAHRLECFSRVDEARALALRHAARARCVAQATRAPGHN